MAEDQLSFEQEIAGWYSPVWFPKEQIVNAVEWWAKTLHATASRQDSTRNHVPTPEQLERFKIALARYLWTAQQGYLLVDYQPSIGLREAADEAGIHVFCFPIKTAVKLLDGYTITYSLEGYGGETIWGTKPESDHESD
jgi:hypothetical protein